MNIELCPTATNSVSIGAYMELANFAKRKVSLYQESSSVTNRYQAYFINGHPVQVVPIFTRESHPELAALFDELDEDFANGKVEPWF
jgi:hypothetical protein